MMIGEWTPPESAELLLEIEVEGDHVPAGSKHGRVVRYKNEKGKWRVKRWYDQNGDEQAQVNVADSNSKKLEARAKVIQEVVLAVAAETGFKIPQKHRPVLVVCTFYRRRSRTVHYGTGRNAKVLKDSAPAYPISAPDTSKLYRGFEDALTGFVWHDDSRSVGQLLDEDFVDWWEDPLTCFALYGLPATVGERHLAEVGQEQATLAV